MSGRARDLEFNVLFVWILPFIVVGWFVVPGLLAAIGLVQQFTEASNGAQILLCAISTGLLGSGLALIQLHAVYHWSGVAIPWVKYTALGWACAGAAWWVEYKFLGGDRFTVASHDLPAVYLVTALIGSLATSLGQWPAVRKCSNRSGYWILVTASGWVSGVMVSFAVTELTSNFLQATVGGYLTHNELFYLAKDISALSIAGVIVGAMTGVGYYLMPKNPETFQ
ncbi:MAG: hypothetical protein M3Z24_03305 [Chloroflexota bacterium]|nr:hypothetical protein [Chloroflexota bacterium]